ncbi:related to inner kinetochore protein MIF2 [Sporisorium scitamineum]|uniref:CENP-C homolog n=1 Tax=Sporisorium scitamineum TaxID=49012 RepID=A0A0F7S2P7_9BASI|nr:related to inner kinetochore protein MIF2 [Sporisorium scitamineum]CDW97197.1 hypothetical protein [Sporisorium scitamineum]
MAPQASRRFHEPGVGSRTGLRLSAVARDQDGFEDLEAFYKASQAALEQQPEEEEQHDDDEDDCDSFDETRFSRRSNAAGVNGRTRPAASSSSMMDIQNSSAPSPRSVLRSAGASAASARNGRMHGNITLADDDDDDDLDLPNLSTGLRSFDLGALGNGNDADDASPLRAPPTPSIPERGLSARKAGTLPSPRAKGKGKETASVRRVDLSDSEDDRILASIQHRLESVYGDDDDQDMGVVSDYDIVPVRPSPLKTTTTMTTQASTSQPKSPKRSIATQKRTEERPTIPAPAAASPNRKRGRPPKSHNVEPELGMAYGPDYDEPDPYDLPPPSPTPPPAAPEQPKRKRGRPPKNAPVEKSSSASTAKKPGRPAASGSKSKSKPAAGEVVERVRSQAREATVFDENGVRRSTRQRFAPLEYWRGERIRYGRPSLPSGTTVEDLRRSHRPGEDEFEDDPSMMLMRKRVPVLDVKEVIRVPRAPGEGTFAGTRRARAPSTTARRKVDRKSEERTPRLTSQTPDPEDGWIQLDPTADTVHVEDGWDEKTVETGVVIDDEEGIEVEMSVVRTKASLRPLAAANQEFRFEKLFNCGGLMATGVLELPPGSRKPTKPSKDNSFVFCVLQGALRATVHRKSFIVGPRGIFQVPAGNTYSLENICQRDVHLFFAQCRKTKKANAGDLTTFTQMSDTSYGTPGLAGKGSVLGGVGGGRYAAAHESAHSEEEEEGSEVEETRAAAAKKPRSDVGKGAKAKAHEPILTADSDAEDSDEDDFETSRQIKTKKRVFRRI